MDSLKTFKLELEVEPAAPYAAKMKDLLSTPKIYRAFTIKRLVTLTYQCFC